MLDTSVLTVGPLVKKITESVEYVGVACKECGWIFHIVCGKESKGEFFRTHLNYAKFSSLELKYAKISCLIVRKQ